MNLLTNEYRVVRVAPFNNPGWSGERQELRQITRFLGLKVWTTVIASEDIPDWALIQLGCFGYTTWVSRFGGLIGAQSTESEIRIKASMTDVIYGRLIEGEVFCDRKGMFFTPNHSTEEVRVDKHNAKHLVLHGRRY